MRPTAAALLRQPMLLLLLAMAAGSLGCAQNAFNATRNLAGDGYCIWYPAESGIEPGQIWLYDGTLRAKFADRPATLAITNVQPSRQLGGLNDATATLSTDFTQLTISKAGPFASELYAGTVKGGTYRLGDTQTASIDPATLNGDDSRYGPGYGKALQMVRDDTPGLMLITSVVRTSTVTYTFYCGDSFKLVERLPRIRDMVHARVDAEVLNEHEIRVHLTPTSGMLVIGVTPIRGERSRMTTEAAQAALAHDLLLCSRQSYALESPVPVTVSLPDGPIISPDDTPAVVADKYKDAIAPPAHLPAATQPGSSGRFLMPSPTSRPGRPTY